MPEEYRSLADLSEDRLFALIGEAAMEGPEGEHYRAVAEGLAGRQTRGERARAVANAWFNRNQQVLHDAICGNESLRRTFSSDPGATVELAKAVGDVLSSAQFRAVRRYRCVRRGGRGRMRLLSAPACGSG